jgi:hypothetical protein
MKIERIKNLIRKAVDDLYLMELDLLERENNEVTISCKLAQYLFLKFPGYHVDCEYNRHFKDIKRINIGNIRKIIKPDIIIHKRDIDKNNLVYIEIKTDHNDESREEDYKRIKASTDLKGEYRYSLGIFIDFYRSKDDLVIRYFQDGEECK